MKKNNQSPFTKGEIKKYYKIYKEIIKNKKNKKK